jgi:hypothetical protein
MTTLTPIAGVTRLRAFQLGLETTPLTTHAATRRMPWTFQPTVNPNWTFVTADTGTLDEAIAPYRLALDVTGTTTGEIYANDVPTLGSAGIMGGISAVGAAAKTWTYAPASTSQDVLDTWTGEWFDDATADAFSGAGGVINDFTLTYPNTGGIITHTANWRFASVTYPATPTGALSVDAAPTPLYATDTTLSVNDTAGAIGTTVFTNQVYDIALTLNNNLDIKRFANGYSTRFQLNGYSRGPRTFDLTITFAQATAAIAETVKWLAVAPSERFFQIDTVSTALVTGATPYEMRWRIPGYWFTRTDTTINTNVGFQLMAHGIYDTTLTYPFQLYTVGSRASL